MSMLAEQVEVVIGVDTHKHTHTAAVVAATTGAVARAADGRQPTPTGYARAGRARRPARGAAGLGDRRLRRLRRRPGRAISPSATSWSSSSTGPHDRRAAPAPSPTRSTPSAPPATPWPAPISPGRAPAGSERRCRSCSPLAGPRSRRPPTASASCTPWSSPPPSRSAPASAVCPPARCIATALRLRPAYYVGDVEVFTALSALRGHRTPGPDPRGRSRRAREGHPHDHRVLATGPAHPHRGRADRRRHRAGGLVACRALPPRRRVRDARRHRSHPGLIGQDRAPPAQPLRRPPTQPGALHRRHHPTPTRPRHPRLRRTPSSRRQDRPRDPSLPRRYVTRQLYRQLESAPPAALDAS